MSNRLDEIRARLEQATPGPWKATHRHAGCTANDDEAAGLGLEIDGPPEAWGRGQFARAADAQLIAHAPEDLRLLLAVADAADALIEHEGDADGYQPPELWSRLGLALAALTEEKAGGQDGQATNSGG